MAPELLQYVGKHNNAWIPTILILEQYWHLFPENDWVYHSLIELYKKINQEDYIIGVWWSYVMTKQVKTAMTLSQHRMWEQTNHHLNRGLQAIFSSSEFDMNREIKEDLRKANEYD